MAACVQVTKKSVLKLSNKDCDYYLLEPSENAALQQLTSGTQQTITLQDVFAIPEASALGLMFQTAFSLVLIVWLTSWAFGSLVNFFSPKYER